jgi:hypothetical protein
VPVSDLQADVTENLVKIRFDLDASDWHGHSSETVWAEPLNGKERRIFRLRNSPFFATGIGHLDIVSAALTDNDMVYSFASVVERGEHSTYMLLFQPQDERAAVYWKHLEDLGCSFESMTIKLRIGTRVLYSVDVPPTADLKQAYELFERGEAAGFWTFQEGYAHMVARPAKPN